MQPPPDELRRADLPTGTRVEVRTRYQGSWSNGFEVAQITDDGYWLRRVSDRYLLPRAFVADDVRRLDCTFFVATSTRTSNGSPTAEHRVVPVREVAVTEHAAPFTEVVVRAAANGHDLERLCRPLLGALAEFASLDSAYLMVIDWERRTQTVRFVHNVGAIEVPEGLELDSPPGLSPQALLGVTVSPDLPETHPDSQVAKHLKLGTYVSVPIVTADHRLFGVLCAAGRIPREVDEGTVSMMEFFARLIADHVSRQKSATTKLRADAAEDKLRDRALFLAEAEHQLQAPLQVVIDSARVLQTHREQLSDDEWYQAVIAIHINSQTARPPDRQAARGGPRRGPGPQPAPGTPRAQRAAANDGQRLRPRSPRARCALRR